MALVTEHPLVRGDAAKSVGLLARFGRSFRGMADRTADRRC